MTERWLPVVGYEGAYDVSDLGRVRAIHPRRGDGFLKGDVDRYGYPRVLLSRNAQKQRFKVHTLVCVDFHGQRPDGMEVAQNNGIKTDIRSTNLRWATRSENIQDSLRHGTHKYKLPCFQGKSRSPVKRAATKYSDELIARIRGDAKAGLGQRRLSKKYGISPSYAWEIVYGDIRQVGHQADAPNQSLKEAQEKVA